MLAADFEEGADGRIPGANHPISGTTPIVMGTWYHAAVTYDGTTLRLYLNGVQDGLPVVVGQPPRFDSIQHAALGTALTSTGAPAGFFAGSLDETRIWNYARSAAQIVGLGESRDRHGGRPAGAVELQRVLRARGRLDGKTALARTLVGTGWSWTPRGDNTLSAAPLNLAPVVFAGADQTVTLPATASLSGSVVDPRRSDRRSRAVEPDQRAGRRGVRHSRVAVHDGQLLGGRHLRAHAHGQRRRAPGSDSVTVVATGVADPALTPKYAVDFGGTNAYVALGQAPGLGAATFTLEAWIRRDGAGIATSTGSGGDHGRFRS